MKSSFAENSALHTIDRATIYWVKELRATSVFNNDKEGSKRLVKFIECLEQRGLSAISPKEKIDFCISAASEYDSLRKSISEEYHSLVSDEERSYISNVINRSMSY